MSVQRSGNIILLVGVVGLAALILLVGYGNDISSCHRQDAPRGAMRDFLAAQAAFQDGLSAFDDKHDLHAEALRLPEGGKIEMSRGEMRRWVADTAREIANRVPDLDCGKFPPDS